MDVVEVLALLLMLSTMELGQVSRACIIITQTQTNLTRITRRSCLLKRKECFLRTYEIMVSYGREMYAGARQCGTTASDCSQSKSRRFHPTRLATTLTSALPSLIPSTHASRPAADTAAQGSGAPDQQGFIIIETNYRLYAYTGERLICMRRMIMSTLH